MAESVNTKVVGHFDCAGGGQVWVDGTTMYIGHMASPDGTSIVDVSDPGKPRLLAHIEIPEGWHSHKARVAGGVLIVNHERAGRANPDFGGGLGIYDVSKPAAPRLITKWRTPGSGVHRYSFDGRYAYISPTVEGYLGNIVMVLDMADPEHPEEVCRWWVPGQWTAGGEEYSWGVEGLPTRCHHPLRLGERLYVSYWHRGLFILDIADMAHPRLVAHYNPGPTFPCPTHTVLPIPQTLRGRRVLVVSQEDVSKLRPAAPSFAWIFDVTHEEQPMPIATYQVAGIDPEGAPQPPMTGCHQPSEVVAGNVIPFAWFAQGLRLIDISDPFAPREVGHYLPDPPRGEGRVCSNDVTIDSRGLIYLVDRLRGVDIIETNQL